MTEPTTPYRDSRTHLRFVNHWRQIVDAGHRIMGYVLPVIVIVLNGPLIARAQTDQSIPSKQSVPPLSISEFQPTPQLKVRNSDTQKARYPVVDVHSHFWIRLKHDRDALEEFVAMMDRNNIAMNVSLDGTLGQQLDDHIRYLWQNHKQRFLIFTNIDWKGQGKQDQPATWACNQPGFAKKISSDLAEAKKLGVSGLKVFKSFGLENRNADGSFTEIDDERFDPIWAACGQLGLPVIMHTADPSAFFEPINPNNERYEELSRRPEWHFPEGKFPRRETLHAARDRLIAKHRNTTFIAAHFGNDAEDLEETSRLLEQHPNVVIEFASRISELGRQPFTAREFFLKHSDRILSERMVHGQKLDTKPTGDSLKLEMSIFPIPKNRYRRKGFGGSTELNYLTMF